MLEVDALGRIVSRLAVADEDFLQGLLRSAVREEHRIPNGDIAALEGWVLCMRIVRCIIERSAREEVLGFDED